ncbi:hypothetical protein CTheo_1869 [Ceratobasidium theobromae]|uniref:C2H2-type domain-containing protein n=1 Tax=Ceratobasidium theobromae TaxID=1582974 RepID=A0A5N5QSI2_9AGAM|nr:hypothetical protein CTheo_1869 [Ceratobasidium theobromae]
MDPFVVESYAAPSPPHIPDPLSARAFAYLRPFLHTFRVDPFSAHDGVRGRPTAAAAPAQPHARRGVTFEFQLAIGDNSDLDNLEPIDPDTDPSEPEPLRYLDGQAADAVYAPAPLYPRPFLQFDFAEFPTPEVYAPYYPLYPHPFESSSPLTDVPEHRDTSPASSLTSESSAWIEAPPPRQSTRQFAPFPPGGMSHAKGKSKVHRCEVRPAPRIHHTHTPQICNKDFKRPSTLKTHMNTHTGARPFACPVPGCGQRFGVQSNLTRHCKGHKRARPRPLQERTNEPWCPPTLRTMRNAHKLSSSPPFAMPDGAAPLPVPLPAVRPYGQPGDENYEERDSFYYGHPMPYHPDAWKIRPALAGPAPTPSQPEAHMHPPTYGYPYPITRRL